MIAQKCVFDTNILIYHLNGALDDNVENLLENILKLNSYWENRRRVRLGELISATSSIWLKPCMIASDCPMMVSC